ncbi:MAG TPA: hypothetical protein VNK48_14475 [Xanthobacteraceae bacterium]|nr:hypothetical protein [Xanthobacteraceae bacterium]
MSTGMDTLRSLLQWRLLPGSHKWPGPDGGTCINEAAIVAAGLDYRPVRGVDELPACFCPVIGAYLIKINDVLPDDERQKLMRFVLRLSGSRDTPAVEQQRLEFIVVETVRRIVSSAMRAIGLPEWAAKCRAATTLQQALDTAAEAAEAAEAARAAAEAAWAAWAAAEAAWAARATLVDDAIAIVDGALAIGKQAPAIDIAVASERLEIKARVTA